MVQMSTAPPDDDVTLDDLVAVLRYYMLCHAHQKHTPTYQHEWTFAVNNFQIACQHEMTRRESENVDAEVNTTGIGKGGGGGTYPFKTPPSTPNSRKMSKRPRDYWNEGFDTSPFGVLGKNDTVEGNVTPNQRIRSIAEELLDTGLETSENEINSGYIYLFKVPGNEGYVKIGFTTREGDTRHEEWKKNCNRELKIIYTATKNVPHARRVEKLVHAELMEHRVRIYCERCGKQHIEWFEVSANMAIASVKKWSLWMTGGPYEEREGSEWHLKETEKKRLHDVGKFVKDLQETVQTFESGKQPF
ncbi:helicase [Metarhizium brunneum]